MHEFTKDKWLCPTLTKNFLILILHTSLTNLVGSYLNPWEWTESANQKEEPLVKSKDTTGRLRDTQVTTHEARSLWEALRTPHSEGRLNFDANCKYTKSMLAPQQIWQIMHNPQDNTQSITLLNTSLFFSSLKEHILPWSMSDFKIIQR